ncbi:hypothetical protein BDN72DRAFT_857968 [Pluteus cervinus]|uniref:Uncharacterized protein n=1 Tax=Pluteus cervinus TaxID=181527 RepID=A0ACD3AUM8_9AGAR|nr:hypothetical protein BDN72DRAFT_857968 [Pluteus cervinus]
MGVPVSDTHPKVVGADWRLDLPYHTSPRYDMPYIAGSVQYSVQQEIFTITNIRHRLARWNGMESESPVGKWGDEINTRSRKRIFEEMMRRMVWSIQVEPVHVAIVGLLGHCTVQYSIGFLSFGSLQPFGTSTASSNSFPTGRYELKFISEASYSIDVDAVGVGIHKTLTVGDSGSSLQILF